MSLVRFHDKVGRTETLPATAGQPLIEVLRAAGIPVNAVLSMCGGKPLSEDVTAVGPDPIDVYQVRHYDLDVTRHPACKVYGTPEPVYTKRVLFDRRGDLETRCEQLDRDGFVSYVEETFVQSLLAKDVLNEGDDIVDDRGDNRWSSRLGGAGDLRGRTQIMRGSGHRAGDHRGG